MRPLFLLLAAVVAAVLTAWARPSITPGTAIALSFRGEAADARITAIHDLSRYSLYVIESADGPICGLAGDAAVAAIPLQGQWDDRADWSPDGITLACVNGAIGKCAIWGYRPWEPGVRDYHQACIRMVRADYCGDGVGHTRDGTPIDVWDARGSVRPDRVPGMDDEAEWVPEGATRIRHTRYASGHGLRHAALSRPPRTGAPGPAVAAGECILSGPAMNRSAPSTGNRLMRLTSGPSLPLFSAML